jgi:hypothetical protein
MSNSDSGPTAPKRLRVSRACEQCRSKKIKCDGIQPTCTPCASQSIRCTYGASPKKRGLAPGSVSALDRTVKLLQRVLGLLLVSVKGADHALVALVQQHAKALLEDAEDGQRLTKRWKEGIVLSTLQSLQEKGFGHLECRKLPSEEETPQSPTLTDRNPRHARFSVHFTPAEAETHLREQRVPELTTEPAAPPPAAGYAENRTQNPKHSFFSPTTPAMMADTANPLSSHHEPNYLQYGTIHTPSPSFVSSSSCNPPIQLPERPIPRPAVATLREEDLSLNLDAGVIAPPASSASRIFPSSSTDTLDDEFGMFDLAWSVAS